MKSVFLNGFIEEEVYVQQPKGFVVSGKEDKVYLLKRALHGLKHAPKAWNARLDSYLLSNGFEKCPYEHSVYFKEEGNNEFVILCVYVDDLLFTGNSERLFTKFKQDMFQEFDMTDNGLMTYFLGIQVQQNSNGISLSQEKYSWELLEKFGMSNYGVVNTLVVPNHQ